MQPTGRGRIVCWEEGSLWLGEAVGDARFHDHHAIQISLTFSGTIRFRTRAGAWRPYVAALIPPHVAHAFEAEAARTAQVFLEPETPRGRALLARFGRDDLVELPCGEIEGLIAPLKSADPAADARVLRTAAERCVDGLGGARAPAGGDARVWRAIALVRDSERAITLEEAAAAVALSPGRFRHLFVAQTGQSFRSYQLWARLQRAVKLLSAGAAATDAAHGAGFSDAAHLTRTFRRMMGIAPTSMQLD